jgi:hypothetical protein
MIGQEPVCRAEASSNFRFGLPSAVLFATFSNGGTDDALSMLREIRHSV